MMRKILSLTAILALIMFTGCTSGQIYDNNYIRAAAVAGDSGKAAVFAFYDENSKTFSSNGSNLDEILRKAELNLGKNVITGHTELIVLGDCDYIETLTFMLNEWKVSPSCLVVYGGPYAAYIIKNIEAETLADSITHAIEQGKAPECDIITVLGGLLSDDKQAEVACVGRYGFDGTVVLK